MRIADRVILDCAQPKPLRGVVGSLLQPPIVEHQRFGLAVFQEQLAVVGPLQPAGHLMADGIAVEIGAVDEGGGGGHGGGSVVGEAEIQDSCSATVSRGAKSDRKAGIMASASLRE